MCNSKEPSPISAIPDAPHPDLRDKDLMLSRDQLNGIWCPDVCPVTFLPFFMWIHHEDRGWVPTYGGPFDSYTIPEPDVESARRDKSPLERVELLRERYDHDMGGWLVGEIEVVDRRLIEDQRLMDMEEAEEKWSDHKKDAEQTAEQATEQLKSSVAPSTGTVLVLDSTLRLGPFCHGNGTPLRCVYLLDDNGHYEDIYGCRLRFVQAGSVDTGYGIAERQLTGVEVYNEEGSVIEFIPYHAIKSMVLKLDVPATQVANSK